MKSYNYNQLLSSVDEVTLINNNLQVFASLILCIVGFIGTLLNTGILIRRCFYRKSLSHHIFIQSLFDSCHLINTLFTHIIIIIIVYMKISIDLRCPLSTFFFSLASFCSIILLSWDTVNRYRYSFRKQSQYRYIPYRPLAHRIILITSISWLVTNFPKLDLNEKYQIYDS